MEGNGHAIISAPSVISDQKELRSLVEDHLLKLSQDLFEMEICAGEVGEGMEGAVPRLLGEINKSLLQLNQLSSQMTDSVPNQIVDNIDRNRNPHSYTKNTLSRATGENQYALGRVLGLESFRNQLYSSISESFPQLPLPERRHQPIPNRIEKDEFPAVPPPMR
ncbi:hypothetical protein TREMEDRAFT_35695 [Tremella mesenterica DSM 1558]|uniref:uncharacterized protein n=1 Tax=Tremella mesenterica (strain ATCC 24925 / CBS 8224 / DSM 1558 / NBRC 9311 / NRRL Y-6157 / RJB 2259-6 / UBC 559-6) TaxID=578456 RepID=UPI00032BDA09|nr:uncharacterized protein TREMEDRAFT_35695 [Tremella mesenterica DSM 1558]EIW65904.1 hypothetical protein TREMEDRAFT_35695 [Tremella mesenterica DSM 1558]